MRNCLHLVHINISIGIIKRSNRTRNISGHKEITLRHICEHLAVFFGQCITFLFSLNLKCPLFRLIYSKKELKKRTLARAGVTHNRYELTLANRYISIFKNNVVLISESNILAFNRCHVFIKLSAIIPAKLALNVLFLKSLKLHAALRT